MIHLREVSLTRPFSKRQAYPFSVPSLQTLETLSFSAPVTIFVGDNGSGKSTLLEAVAMAAGSVTVGREDAHRDRSLDPVRPLAGALKLIWNQRTHRGFFLRAEDFFGYVQRLREMRQTLQEELTRVDREYGGRSDYARTLAKSPAASSLRALSDRYGADLDANSHGEGFLTLFQSRVVPGGLYLLDEPEAALSPLRQLGLVSLLHDMVDQNSQFILATHSPILLAFPGAALLDFDQSPPQCVSYDELGHVQLYRAFMEDPGAYLHHLTGKSPGSE